MAEPAAAPASLALFPSPARAWWLVGVLCGAAFLSYVDRLILNVLVDPMRHELAISDAQFSLIQGAGFAIIYVFAGLPLGWLADRRRRLTVITSGMLVWCAGVILCGLAAHFWELLAARAVVGIGEAALAPAAVSLIADAFPPARRAMALGVFLIGFLLGGPAAIAIGGALLQFAQSARFAPLPGLHGLTPWREVLVLLGSLGLTIPILSLTLREPDRKERSAAGTSFGDVLARFRADWHVLLPLYGAMALMSVGDYALLSWLPTLLSREFHELPARLGLYFGAIAATTAIGGTLAGGALADWIARRQGTRGRLKLAGFVAATATVGPLLVSEPTQALVFAGLGIWSFASALALTTGIAVLQEVLPNEDRGFGISLAAFCNTLLGLGIAPTVVAVAAKELFYGPRSLAFSILLISAAASISASGLFMAARPVRVHQAATS
jgi:MFS family permease